MLWLQILSMKLAAVNPRIDFSLDSLLATDVSYKLIELTQFYHLLKKLQFIFLFWLGE